MGQCYGKTIPTTDHHPTTTTTDQQHHQSPLPSSTTNGIKSIPSRSPWSSPFPHGIASPLPAGVSPSPAHSSTPGRRFFKRPFPPPSPAKHIKASLARRFGHAKHPRQGPIPEHAETLEPQQFLDKNFGYNNNFEVKYELGKEIGRGHFGHTCHAKAIKGDVKDLALAVKVISKLKVIVLLLNF